MLISAIVLAVLALIALWLVGGKDGAHGAQLAPSAAGRRTAKLTKVKTVRSPRGIPFYSPENCVEPPEKRGESVTNVKAVNARVENQEKKRDSFAKSETNALDLRSL